MSVARGLFSARSKPQRIVRCGFFTYVLRVHDNRHGLVDAHFFEISDSAHVIPSFGIFSGIANRIGMRNCKFSLNDEPMSAFEIDGRKFPAFSGLTPHINKRSQQCLKAYGPIPLGTYYIVDRQSGGRLGRFHDLGSGKSNWFALYAVDD